LLAVPGDAGAKALARLARKHAALAPLARKHAASTRRSKPRAFAKS
jgi:hypothetical protein